MSAVRKRRSGAYRAPRPHDVLLAPETTGRSVRQLQRAITAWADRVFPERTIEGTIRKLVDDEIPEFLARSTDAGEYADLVILILDIAGQQGIDVERAVVNKMNVNARRKWRKVRDGKYQHT